MQIVFKVQGSAIEPYEVSFSKNEENVTAHCTCPAGSVGQYCKHRLSILQGNNPGVVSGNENEISTVRSWVMGTDVGKALAEVSENERIFEDAKAKLAKSKKRLARALMN
jgi:hypothetical protein